MTDEYLWTIPSRDTREVSVDDDMDTIPKCLLKGLSRYEPLRTFGTRSFLPDESRGDYEWYSYADLFQNVNELMAGFEDLELQEGDKVGIMAQNRVEWAMTDFACMSAGIIAVPIYDNQGLPDIEYIINHSDVKVLFVSIDCLTKINTIGLDKLPTVKRIVLMDDRLDDRVWALKYLPSEMIARFTSTQYKTNEVMDLITEQYKEQFEKLRVEDPELKDGIQWNDPDADLNRKDWETRKQDLGGSKDEDEGLDIESCSYLYAYQASSFIKHRFIDGDNARSDNEALAALITDTYSGVREKGFLKIGPNVRSIYSPVGLKKKTEDLATFIYTSGTTGNPKGAMISHQNLVWGAAVLTDRGGLTQEDFLWPFVPMDYFINYLPYGHVFARVLNVRVLTVCEHNGYYQGDTRVLMDDIKTLRPTILPMVPRICQKIYDSVMLKMNTGGFIKKNLFKRAMAVKHKRYYGKGKWDAGIYDRLVFSKLKALVGGRVRIMYSGSAPLPKHVGEFIQLSLCPNLIEGYGATETSCQGLLQHHHLRRMGDLGFPSGGHQAKLEAVLHYSPTEDIKNNIAPRGQICIKGPCIFMGYYKNEEATNAVLDKDGWYRTGDVGTFIEDRDNVMNSHAKIIDRVKNVFKLAQGEFVCSDAVSAVATQTTGIGQFFLYGNGEQAYVLGVAVPDAPTFAERAEKISSVKHKNDEVDEARLRTYCEKSEIIADIHKQLYAKSRELGLRGFEIPRAILLDPVAWTDENGLMTPSMKPKTAVLKSKYRATFEKLYEYLNEAGLDKGREVKFDEIAKLSLKATTEVPF